jgi:hypothetical protein
MGRKGRSPLLPKEATGHPQMEKNRRTVLELHAQAFSPPCHPDDPVTVEPCQKPQTGIEHLDIADLLTREDSVELPTEGFHFGKFRQGFILSYLDM